MNGRHVSSVLGALLGVALVLAGAAASAAPVLFSGNGHWYEFIPGNLTWYASHDAAMTRTFMGMRGYLATITSAAENTFLSQTFADQDGWIGGSDEETEGVWKWITGPEAGTIFWDHGTTLGYASWGTIYEPNNYMGIEDHLVFGVHTPGGWNDLNGNLMYAYYNPGYYVEYSADYPLAMLTSVTVDPEGPDGRTSNAPGAWSSNTADPLSQVGAFVPGGFLNQGSSENRLGEVSIPLCAGINKITLYGNGVFPVNPYYGCVLFFDGAQTPPQVAVYNKNGGTDSFMVQPAGATIMGGANGGLFFDRAPGTSVYQAPNGTRVEVLAFMINAICSATDVVSYAGIGGNGTPDMSAQLVLLVTPASNAPARPEPRVGVTPSALTGTVVLANGGALLFDGKNDDIDCGKGASLNIRGDLTIEAWIKAAGDGDIVQKYYDWAPGNGVGFRVYNGALAFWDGTRWASGSRFVRDDLWHHVAVVGCTATSNGMFYVDGRATDMFPYSPSPDHSAQTLYVGSHIGYTGFFDGAMDEVRVYSRALSTGEIAQSVRSLPPTDGLAGGWTFDEGFGTTAGDSSGFGNRGSIRGAEWAFGIGSRRERTVTITNAGRADLDFTVILPAAEAADWLTVDPAGGVLAAGSNTVVRVSFNAAGFRYGEEADANLAIVSNDPDLPVAMVPVSLFAGDFIPPHTGLGMVPAANAYGWHRTPVSVTLQATDDGSGAAALHSSVDGVAFQIPTNRCVFSVSGEGSHTVLYHAVDGVGTVESGRAAQIRIDATPPRIGLTAAPVRGVSGSRLIQVSCVVTDNLSGVRQSQFGLLMPGVGGFQYRLARNTQLNVMVDLRQRRITIHAPNPEAVLQQIQSGLLGLGNAETVRLQKIPRSQMWRFLRQGSQLKIEGPSICFRATATDFADNTARAELCP